MKTVKVTDNETITLQWIKELYEKSFPKIERVDFSLLIRCVKAGTADMFAYFERGRLTGFAFVLLPSGYAYLLFCAVTPELRGKGYGTDMMKKLSRHYKSRTLVLDIEPVSENAPNSNERLQRYLFYKRLGYQDTGLEMRDHTGEFRFLTGTGTLDTRRFTESYRLLPEIFEGTQIVQVQKEK